MKYDNIQAFEQYLKGEQLGNLYLIVSKEDYDREKAGKLVIERCKQSGDGEYVQLNGEKLQPKVISSEINGIPMFADKKVIAILNADKLPKASTQLLEEYCENPNAKVQLIISMGSINRRTKFFKKAEANGFVVDIPEEKPWEKERSMSAEIQKLIQAEGKKIQPRAVQELCQHLGTDRALLPLEIEKLVCYVGERSEITTEDIATICTTLPIGNVWQLGDAIFDRKAGKALLQLRDLLDSGEVLFLLLRQLRTQFQTRLSIASILASGGNPGEIQKRYPYMRGRILDGNIQSAQRYGEPRLRQGLLAIDESELSAKSSGMDPRLLMERLIMKLTV